MLKHTAALGASFLMIQGQLAILMSYASAIALRVKVTSRTFRQLMIATTSSTFIIGIAAIGNLFHTIYTVRGAITHATYATRGGAATIHICLASLTSGYVVSTLSLYDEKQRCCAKPFHFYFLKYSNLITNFE